MLKLIIPVIIILHGAVHIWYVLLIGRVVNFTPEMGWTGKSWLLPGVPVEGFYRISGMMVYGLAALIFIASGTGMLMNSAWYPAGLLMAAIISSIAVLFFFDGRFHMLMQKGLTGLILNGIIILILIVKQLL